jgi:hypothetical protein
MHYLQFFTLSLRPDMFRRTERHLQGMHQRFLLLADSIQQKPFHALPEDDVPYVETCRGKAKE